MSVFSHFPYRYFWEKCYGNPEFETSVQQAEVWSVCRLCAATCGVVARFDAQGRLARIIHERSYSGLANVA